MRTQKAAPRKNSGDKALFADGTVRVLERERGFYWCLQGEKRLYGPYATLLEVVDDIDTRTGRAAAEEQAEESLEDMERDMGLNGWIDPDTGLPAEDGRPRLELH